MPAKLPPVLPLPTKPSPSFLPLTSGWKTNWPNRAPKMQPVSPTRSPQLQPAHKTPQKNKPTHQVDGESGIAVIEYVLLLSIVVIAVYAALTWTDLKVALQAVITELIDKINR